MPHIHPKVVVVGSLNIDYIASVPALPRAGETISATALVQKFGGKGANQAVAAARQGARVTMIGCVGDDDHGRAYRNRLRREGIEIRAIASTSRALTGTALIAVDASAENLIIVAAGANGELTAANVRRHGDIIARADALLLQQEIPLAAEIEAIRIANKARVPVMLNPSPLRNDFPWGKCRIDTLIVNVGEGAAIFRLDLGSFEKDLVKWQRQLAAKQITRLLITRGAKSTLCIDESGWFETPALRVKPVDTVGAGDAFAGAFAARVAEGVKVSDAVRYANCAGGLATLKSGAQESIPSRAETEKAARRLA